MPSMSKDLAYSLDPALWCTEVLGLRPDPWQAVVLRSPSKRVLLCCSRQSGKSTITSAQALHTAVYRPGSLILCLSPTLRQSSELFRNVAQFYQCLGHEVPSVAESVLRLELANGSRIVALPGKEQNIRGMAKVALMICDEAARIEDALYYSVRPMLAVSNGRLIALSTPFGTRGWFHTEWTKGQDWQKHQITADQCPRISKDFLDEERRVLGSYWFDQEYECRFLDAQTQLLRKEDVDKMFDQTVEAWTL